MKTIILIIIGSCLVSALSAIKVASDQDDMDNYDLQEDYNEKR